MTLDAFKLFIWNAHRSKSLSSICIKGTGPKIPALFTKWWTGPMERTTFLVWFQSWTSHVTVSTDGWACFNFCNDSSFLSRTITWAFSDTIRSTMARPMPANESKITNDLPIMDNKLLITGIQYLDRWTNQLLPLWRGLFYQQMLRRSLPFLLLWRLTMFHSN